MPHQEVGHTGSIMPCARRDFFMLESIDMPQLFKKKLKIKKI